MPTRRTLLVGAGALAATSATGFYVDRQLQQSLRFHRERISRGSLLFNSKVGQIEYAVVGEGSPVLFVHGAGGGFDQAANNSGALVEAGLSVICPSRFGYLRSANPVSATPEMQAKCFAELLDHLKIDRVPIVGISAGAVSAVQFAARHPERCSAMVLVVPAATAAGPEMAAQGPAPQGGPFARALVQYAVGSDLMFWLGCSYMPRQMFASVLATNADLIDAASPQERNRAENLMWNIMPISARVEGLVNDVRFTSTPMQVDLSAIKVPTLTISLEDDLYGTAAAARHIAANVPGARAIIYPTGGHIFIGREAEVFGETLSFIRSHSS